MQRDYARRIDALLRAAPGSRLPLFVLDERDTTILAQGLPFAERRTRQP